MHITAQTFLNEEERGRIDAAVEAAEQKTSGEIVPVLATTAEPYGHGLFLAALSITLLATLSVVAFYFLPLPFLAHLPWEVPIYVVLPVQVLALLGGYHAARRLPSLHRAFVSHAYMQRRVDAAAHQAFHRFHLTHTRDATGIMIYVSLFERMVVVVADKAINDKHDKATWDEVRDLIVEAFKAGDPAAGFERAVQRCGEILEQDFPIAADDTNELPNHLRMM